MTRSLGLASIFWFAGALAVFPFIKCIFADAAYQGPKTAAAIAKTGTWKLEIVKRDELHRFLVLPRS
jgi:hypothetical protein